MSRHMRLISVLFVALLLPGCTFEPVDDNHPFSGEWTSTGGHLMVFMDGNIVCTTEWIVNNSTADHVVDCLDAAGMSTISTMNFSFVDEVLFMQTIHILIEYSDPDTNTSSTDTSDVMICAAYVPREIAADATTWEAEVNSVTWPSYCEQVIGIEA